MEEQTMSDRDPFRKGLLDGAIEAFAEGIVRKALKDGRLKRRLEELEKKDKEKTGETTSREEP
jgi:hypothetical protein